MLIAAFVLSAAPLQAAVPTTPAPEQARPVLAPPAPLAAAPHRVGTFVPEVSGVTLDGAQRGWRSARGEQFTVLALTSVECPLSRKFGPAVARLEAEYAARGVKFVHINVSGLDSPEAMRKQRDELKLAGLYLADAGAIANALDARTTTEVFVVDGGNTLRYRGAVSDQYGAGFAHDEPRNRYLADALDALLNGREPYVRATHAPGCAIERDSEARTAAATPTFTRDVSRIVQAHCQDCHRSGGAAPFAFDSYESVAKRATTIAAVLEDGSMPPWFAAPVHGSDGARLDGPWSNERALSGDDKRVLLEWIAAGKPRGDDSEAPLPRAISSDTWTIGAPDAVYRLPEPIAVKAEGTMRYQIVLVPTKLEQDTWVSATQILPTDRSVVHHVLVFTLPEAAIEDRELRRRAAIDETSGFFAAYVPGNDACEFPPGFAKRLPARSALMFQIHYTPNGKATTDQLALGLRFAKQAPRHAVHTYGISNTRFAIPAGAARHEVKAQTPLPYDARLLAFMPHMHMRGAAFRYELQSAPDAARTPLLEIPRYDFNWQLRYALANPVDAPRGAVVHATAWFDNSSANPANPDPTRTVRWGEQTFDEMMIGYVEYYLPGEDPENPVADAPRERAKGAPSFAELLQRFDANRDGVLTLDESPTKLQREFRRLDRDGDGKLTAGDFQ
jgi:hypothetical protein